MTTKSLSHAKSDAEVTPEWIQRYLHAPKVIPRFNKSFKSSFTFFPIIRKSGSLEAPKPRSLEASKPRGASAGIAKRNQWEIPYTGAIRTIWAIGGNCEAKSILRHFSKIQAPSVLMPGIAKRNQIGNAVILAGPRVQGMFCFL